MQKSNKFHQIVGPLDFSMPKDVLFLRPERFCLAVD
jgi:hypothetical protein